LQQQARLNKSQLADQLKIFTRASGPGGETE